MAGFPTTPVLDTFDRANEGPPMTGWSDGIAGLKVVSNTAMSSVNGTSLSLYSGLALAGDTEIYCTVTTKPGAGKNVALYRMDGSLNGYAIYVQTGSPDAFLIFRVDALVGTLIGSGSLTLTAGQKIGYQRLGDTHHMWQYDGSAWTHLGFGTDSTYNGTADGLWMLIDDNIGAIDDVGGGIAKKRFFLLPN